MDNQIKYHKDGNKDLVRGIYSLVPQTLLASATLGNMYLLDKMAGYDNNLVSELQKQSVKYDPRIKTSQFKWQQWQDNTLNRYDIPSKTAYYAKGHYGMAAHELGHAQQYSSKNYRRFAAPIAKLSRFGLLNINKIPLSVFTDNIEDAKKVTAVQTLLNLPVLAEEFDASRRGAQMLSKTSKFKKLSSLRKAQMMLRPFSGFGSYAALAAIPYISYKYLKNKELYEGKY